MPQPFHQAVITDNGIHLLTRAQAGEVKIEFTRIETGNGIYEEQEKCSEVLKTKTGLKSVKNSFCLSGIKIHSENSVKVSALITNYDSVTKEITVTEGYYINEIGLYAREKDGTDSAEVLYSIAVTSGENGDFIPTYNGVDPVEIIQDYYATVNSSEEVTVQGDNRVPALAIDLQQAEEKMSAMKEKLDGIDENANNYTHPATAGNKHIPPGGAAGQVLKYSGSSGTASWGNSSYYGTCSTAAETAAKTVSLSGFSLFTGATVAVMFSNGNTAENPTLNVNSTGAKTIYYRGKAIARDMPRLIDPNDVLEMIYDGSHWVITGNSIFKTYSGNFDDVYIPGLYSISGTNGPVPSGSGTCSMIVLNSSRGVYQQIAIKDDSTRMFMRYSSSFNDWSKWYEIMVDDVRFKSCITLWSGIICNESGSSVSFYVPKKYWHNDNLTLMIDCVKYQSASYVQPSHSKTVMATVTRKREIYVVVDKVPVLNTYSAFYEDGERNMCEIYEKFSAGNSDYAIHISVNAEPLTTTDYAKVTVAKSDSSKYVITDIYAVMPQEQEG